MAALSQVTNGQTSDASHVNQYAALFQGGTYHDVFNGYGAVGDGVTDDTTAVQNAIATGGHVYIPQGKTFVVSNVSLDTDGQVIFGGGTLKLKAGAFNCLRFGGANQRVEGITFDGTTAANTVALVDGQRGSIVHGCHFSNIGTAGVYLAGAPLDGLIDGNRFTGTRGYGVLSESSSSPERIMISNNIFIGGTDGDGIEINSPTGVARDISSIGNTITGYSDSSTSGIGIGYAHVTDGTISGNIITDCGQGGVHLEDGTTGVTIADNTVARVGSNGITVLSLNRSSHHITISGNTVVLAAGYGIALDGAYPNNYNTIAHNVVRSCGTPGNAGAGIVLAYQTVGNVVIGNIVSNTVGATFTAGIDLGATASTIVEGNICFDDQTPKTQMYGLIVIGDQTDVRIVNNDFSRNLTTAIEDTTYAGTLTRYYKHSNAGVTPVAVTGSRGGNAALASALTQLAAMGLITDSSS